MSRPVVLTLCAHYLPGFRAGGPTRTVANMVARLGDELDFRIVTADRDFGSDRPYEGVPRGRWVRRGRAAVLYLPDYRRAGPLLSRLLRREPHDVLYLNSLFNPWFTARPLLLGRAGLGSRAPVVVATRGELAPAALAIKPARKRAYLALARALGLHRRVLWQASSDDEAARIRAVLGASQPVVVAPDLAAPPDPPDLAPIPKAPGVLEAIFLGRVSPMKNLEAAIALLGRVRGRRVRLSLYGPLEGADYWRRCRAAAARLPPGITVEHRGTLPPEEVPRALARHHLLLLPTRGENFGHAILEALSAGCPVLISDRTPWRGLREAGAGWDLPLEQPDAMVAALQAAVDLDEAGLQRLREGALAFARAHAARGEIPEQNRELFRRAMAMGGGG